MKQSLCQRGCLITINDLNHRDRQGGKYGRGQAEKAVVGLPVKRQGIDYELGGMCHSGLSAVIQVA